MITGVGVLLCSATFLLIEQYIVLAVIGFTLFGIGLGFYATPSTDAALSNVPEAQVGLAAGIYTMASSLGSAIGVAVFAALCVAGQAVSPEFVQSWGLFIGRQDTIALRFGGAIGLLFNVFMVVIALASIILTVPSQKKLEAQRAAAEKGDTDAEAPVIHTGEALRDVAPPPIGN
ncbi:hypothetical protein AB0I45_11790 [Brevibacterium sp. NPDC049920]